MDAERVRASYSARAGEYIAAFGAVETVDRQDLERLRSWAHGHGGPVLDVGCGPGVLAGYLAGTGITIAGIDLVPEFIDAARRAQPGVPFRVGSMAALGVPDGALGALLAWYSLIHLEPERLPPVLEGFRRALRPGGGLAVGFFDGDTRERFPHQVLPAYRWPVDDLAGVLAAAGFTEQERWTRTSAGQRPHAALLATRD